MGPGAIIGGVQMLAGGLQGLIGSRRAARTQRELENLATPTATANGAINNYYADANASPTDTAMYKLQQQNIARNAANSMRQAQDRHGALALVGNLARANNDASLRATAQAEQLQDSKLRSATAMKVQDDNRLFDINKMMPYEKKFKLLAQKAAGANALANAGWRNLFGGAQTIAMGSGAGQPQGTPNYLSYGQGE